MQLYLIRHAQSQNNALPESQRVEDPGVTDLGVEQAKHLAEWIPTLKLTKLFTSPFRRALETAEPIRLATSLTPEVRVDLHEIGGCYSGYTPDGKTGRPGMNRAEIAEQFPNFEVAPDIDGEGWWASKPFETWDAASERAVQLLRWTRDEFADTDERIAFVMHADFKLLVLEHLDVQPTECPRNASVTTLRFTRGETQLAEYNRIEHLPAEFVTW